MSFLWGFDVETMAKRSKLRAWLRRAETPAACYAALKAGRQALEEGARTREQMPHAAEWPCAGYRGEVDFVVLRNGDPVPIQVSWDGPTERHHKALDAFCEAHPRVGEAVFVTAVTFEGELRALTDSA